jgi:hypothetical protein
MPPGRAQVWLRFSVPEIIRLALLLHLDKIDFRNCISVDPTTALCVVCARLSYPGRWWHLVDLVFNDTITFLIHKFSEHLWWHRQLTQYTRLLEFSEAVHRIGGVSGVWGFVDGTFRGHRRPKDYNSQRTVYLGHKRAYGMNYQAIITPDGLVSSIIGSFARANNDWAMWKRSGCKEEIRQVMDGHETLYIEREIQHNASFGVACPFKHPQGRCHLTHAEQHFNKALSTVRIAVEQAFGDIQVQWTYTAFGKGLTAGAQPVAA